MDILPIGALLLAAVANIWPVIPAEPLAVVGPVRGRGAGRGRQQQQAAARLSESVTAPCCPPGRGHSGPAGPSAAPAVPPPPIGRAGGGRAGVGGAAGGNTVPHGAPCVRPAG